MTSRMDTRPIFFILLALVLLAYFASYRFMFDNADAKTSQFTQKEFLRIIVIGFFGFGIPLFVVSTSKSDIHLLQIVLASLLSFTATALLLWVAKSLGKNYSPTLQIQTNHTLITTGPYKLVRHPMYSAFFLWFIAQSILVPGLIVPAASSIAASLILFQRIPAEELLLQTEFGEKYNTYKQTTKRLVPYIY